MAKEITSEQLATSAISDNRLAIDDTGSWFKKVREMRTDPTIALVRHLYVAPALAAGWSIETTPLAPEGAAEHIREQILPLRFHTLRTAMQGCLDFGWQPFEKVWSLEDGRYWITRLKPLLQDITEVVVEDTHGAFNGFYQAANNYKVGEVWLPLPNSLLFNFDVEGTYWYGTSTMRNVEDAYDNNADVSAAARRYDKKVAGSHWLIKYPPGQSIINGQSQDNFTVATEILGKIEAVSGFVVPKYLADMVTDLNENTPDAWSIELLEASGQTSDQFSTRQAYLDRLKVRGFGFPERSILEGQFGTRADAGAHGDFALTGVELRHQELCLTINWHLINQILRYNYGSEYENTVYVKPNSLHDDDTAFLGEVYKTLLTNPETLFDEVAQIDIRSLREKLGIPVEETVEEVDVMTPLKDLLEPAL